MLVCLITLSNCNTFVQGDTFRWKGENVATSEVAQVIGVFNGIESNVYGVEIPKCDGRAGMAALTGVNDKKFDFEGFAKHLLKELPRYAVPLFLRFMPAQEVTSTFKHLKGDLRKVGFDPNHVKDPLYFFDGKSYVPLTPEIFAKLTSGEIRV
jgi:fatty-acyl-CoA synthase